jgi:hypothetical protein
VALVRVYCGLASTQSVVARGTAEAWLTVAVVDDAGRLMDVCDLSDDPAGYVRLGSLLAERSGGGTATVAVAADSDEHQVTLLLAAAGRPLAIVEEDSLDDYANRFGDDDSADELDAPVSERRAIGLARALQAGVLAASTQSAPRELMALKPVLAAHAALAAGRQGAAVALREVLRELYPAALRAYPDPAEAIPLAILDALPEPGLLGGTASNRGRDAAVAADLAGRGLADHETISEAITALRVAIAETPRRTGIGKTLTTAVAETIQQAVAAVRACDTGIAALVGLLAEKSTPVGSPGRERPSASAPLRAVRAEPVREPVTVPTQRRGGRPQPAPVVVDPLRAASVATPVVPHGPVPAGAGSRRAGHVAASHAQPEQLNPPRGGTGAFPVAPPVAVPSAPPVAVPPSTPGFVPSVADPYPSQSYSYPSAYVTGAQPIAPSPEVAPPGSRADWPINSTGTPPPPPASVVTNGYPVTSLPPTVLDRRPVDPPVVPRQRDGRVTPPWQANDLPTEPPALRLVEPAPLADPALREDTNRSRTGGPERDYLAGRDRAPEGATGRDDLGRTGDLSRGGDLSHGGDLGRNGAGARGAAAAAFGAAAAFNGERRPSAAAAFARSAREPREPVGDPSPRLTDSTSRLEEPTRRPGEPISAPPVADEGDGDLLIFAQARSAWFTGHLEQSETTPEWSNPADLGWQAAERASQPVFGEETSVGLPRRVPQANLVPGSPLPPASSDRSLRIVRDPAAMAAHTTGYFRGSRRGEEVRGFAVGGRPGREAAGGWDFSRDGWEADRDERDYGYRSASHR